jgi:sulfate transport system substrate-binding protein
MRIGFGALSLLALLLTAAGLGGCSGGGKGKGEELLNVSYDPTRELYRDVNRAFADQWERRTGRRIAFNMSHGGSGKQSRAIVDGLDADVATLALAYDLDSIAARRPDVLSPGWQQRLPDRSAPYTSTIVFLVRKGNPRHIHDWNDLARPGIKVITPNPKTSGGARWNFLAAWGYGLRTGHSQAAARGFVARLYANVPVLDAGARGATTTFSERGIGDVLIAWESEAFLARRELGAGKLEMVIPSISILAEPPVALLDGNAKRRGTTALADAYLHFLYTPEGQEIIARNHYRPRDPAVAARHARDFPKIEMLEIDRDFGGWAAAQKKFFADGGLFDRIYSGLRH